MTTRHDAGVYRNASRSRSSSAPFPASLPAQSPSGSVTTDHSFSKQMLNPYIKRHGRCYLSDQTLAYPLPCDVLELHRQNLRTLLLIQVFGAPFCAPSLSAQPPTNVLDVACGTGVWSSLCHDHFAERGAPPISFTGLDIAPLAPDLSQAGLDWTFVRHDLRKLPLPFADGQFDFIMLKDLSLVVQTSDLQDKLMDEYLRILRPGGVLEAWETDHTLRTLLPHAASAPGISDEEQRRAESLAIFPLHPSTPRATPQNPYLQDLNVWVRQTLEEKRLTPTPCTAIGPMMLQEAEALGDQGARRVAILLGEAKWEREGVSESVVEGGSGSKGKRSVGRLSDSSSTRRRRNRKSLNQDQAALRRTALLTFVQMMESIEHLLQQASGRSQDEWDRWWAGMMEDLLVKGSLNGECLEIGAWWGRKL